MNVVILRPHPMVDPLEAKGLRDNFDLLPAGGGAGVIVDLTGVQELSGAGLAAVTNILMRGKRTGIAVRVLLPAEGTDAARVIDQADLRRFIRPGGMWNPVSPASPAPVEAVDSRSLRHSWFGRGHAADCHGGRGAPAQAVVA